jgi:hypothetical protein
MSTTTTRHGDGTIDIVQRGPARWKPSPDELQVLYWRAVRGSTLGLVRFSRNALSVLGLWPVLLRFGPTIDGARPIVGGLFARRPHGMIRWTASGDEVVVAVESFEPLLAGPLWRFEAWFHDVVGRRFLALASTPGR